MIYGKSRTCGKPRNTAPQPAPREAPTQPLPGDPRLPPSAPSYSSVVSSPSPAPSSTPAPAEFQHPTLKVGPLAEVKHVTTTLAQMGITVTDTDVLMTASEAQPLPKCAQASSDALLAKSLYEQALEKGGEDSPLTKALKSELDKVMNKAGPVAQMANQKQNLETKLAITKRRGAMEADHERVRKLEHAHLEHLQRTLAAQKDYIATMESNFKADLDHMDSILAKIAEQEQQVEALKPSGQEEVSVPRPVVPDPALLAHPIFDTLRTAVHELLNGLTAETPTAPSDTITQLTEVLATMPSATTPPPAPAPTFGPAAAQGTLSAARLEAAPYNTGDAGTPAVTTTTGG